MGTRSRGRAAFPSTLQIASFSKAFGILEFLDFCYLAIFFVLGNSFFFGRFGIHNFVPLVFFFLILV
jgi:hypothetical protein